MMMEVKMTEKGKELARGEMLVIITGVSQSDITFLHIFMF